MLNLNQTIEEAQSTYAEEERVRLGHIIAFLAWESAQDLQSAAQVARTLYNEANRQRLVSGKSPLPDLKYFAL